MKRFAQGRIQPRDPVLLAQRRRGFVLDVYLDGKLMRHVMACNPRRRLVTVATTYGEKGMFALNVRRDAVHKTQLVGDVRLEWRRVGK